jgi:multiple sugar transport system ATP-binding protein
MIAGLESITSGELWIGDKLVNMAPPKERDIAMVFQNYALYPHMTVYENMAFSMRLRKAPQAETDERTRKAADILGLTPLLDRYPRQLSGGQRQRVAMGRAIVRDPALFLFDEPLSNLDAKLRVQMRTEIKALHQRVGGTTVYVTHDQIEAMTMADQIVVMQGGHVEQIGAPLELYDHPANQFVAGFIGSPAMNFVKGRARRDDAGLSVITEGGETVRAPQDAAVTDGQPVVMGFRPEHLTVTDGDEGIGVEVVVVEPTGSEIHVAATHGADAVTAVFRERLALSPGQRIRLSPDLARAHLFDAGTGRTLRA